MIRNRETLLYYRYSIFHLSYDLKRVFSILFFQINYRSSIIIIPIPKSQPAEPSASRYTLNCTGILYKQRKVYLMRVENRIQKNLTSKRVIVIPQYAIKYGSSPCLRISKIFTEGWLGRCDPSYELLRDSRWWVWCFDIEFRIPTAQFNSCTYKTNMKENQMRPVNL